MTAKLERNKRRVHKKKSLFDLNWNELEYRIQINSWHENSIKQLSAHSMIGSAIESYASMKSHISKQKQKQDRTSQWIKRISIKFRVSTFSQFGGLERSVPFKPFIIYFCRNIENNLITRMFVPITQHDERELRFHF